MSLDACPSLQICFLVFQPTQYVFHVAFVLSFTFLPSNSLISYHGPHKTDSYQKQDISLLQIIF